MVQGEEVSSDGVPERIAAAEREIADLQLKVDALRQSQPQHGGQAPAMGAQLDLKVSLCAVALHHGAGARLGGLNGLWPAVHVTSSLVGSASGAPSAVMCGAEGLLRSHRTAAQGCSSAVVLRAKAATCQQELQTPQHPPLQSLKANAGLVLHVHRRQHCSSGPITGPGGWVHHPTQARWCCPQPCRQVSHLPPPGCRTPSGWTLRMGVTS